MTLLPIATQLEIIMQNEEEFTLTSKTILVFGRMHHVTWDSGLGLDLIRPGAEDGSDYDPKEEGLCTF